MRPLRLPLALAVVFLCIGLVGYLAWSVASGPTPSPRYAPTAYAAVPAPAQPAAATPTVAADGSGRTPRPAASPTWVAGVAAASGIPAPAVRAYADAQLAEPSGCGLGWTTLAGIGWVESQHGTFGGRTLGADGVPSTPILGPTLDGSGDVAALRDRDGDWAKAVGPMQFIPSTWARWASDGDADGTANIQDLDDAALAAARYLCSGGYDLATGPGWAAAVYSYNHSQDYVDQVYAAASAYAARTAQTQ